RATILTAEGVKQSQILTAEGEKQSNILRAEGTAQAAILNAEGEARAIQKLLAYQYLQVLPQIARGDANKLWIVPSELGDALKGIGGVLGTLQATDGNGTAARARRQAAQEPDDDTLTAPTLQDPNEALAEARREAAGASAEAEGAAPAGV